MKERALIETIKIIKNVRKKKGYTQKKTRNIVKKELTMVKEKKINNIEKLEKINKTRKHTDKKKMTN